jgi:predicted acetyltransferase
MNFFANTGAVQLSIRGAKEADLDRLVEVHAACYPDSRTAAQRRINLVQNPWSKGGKGGLSDLHVAELDGRIVGHGFGFRLTTYFGGELVPAVGIASVGVAPEARGRDVGARIVSHIENQGRERGAVLALLYAFRHGFYAKRGYADVTPMHRLGCDPRAIPFAWVAKARRALLHAATAKDVRSVIALHGRSVKRSTGGIERPATLWTRIFASERFQIVVLEGAAHGAAGYVVFELLQDEEHARTRLDVHDLVADSDEARRTLWGLLGMQAGQVAEINVEIAEDDPIAFALTDIDGVRFGDERVEHALGSIVAGPMIRMLDVRRALGARGYATTGDVDVKTKSQTLRITARAGRGQLAKSPKRASPLTTDERTLTSMAFGGLGVTAAARLGLVRGTEETIGRADILLRLAPFVTRDRF